MSNLHADTVLYVRDTMLPQAEPPMAEAGAIKWLRENLFAGWFNTILTVLGLLIVGSILNSVFYWAVVYGHWNAGSLSECRELIAAQPHRGSFQIADILALPVVFLREVLVGVFSLDPGVLIRSPLTAWNAMTTAMSEAPETTGACWAVITERWPQYLFGFYPSANYWRPILAFALLFVALAPVLYPGVPRKVLWFTAIYPALAAWLLWGGSVWVPVMVMAGIAAVIVAIALVNARMGAIWASIAGVAALCLIFLDPLSAILSLLGAIAGLFTQGPVSLDFGVTIAGNLYSASDIFPLLPHGIGIMDYIAPIGIESIASDKFGGFLLSITIGVACISLSLPIGILLALGRRSDMLLVKAICVGFIEFIRGVPLITLLFTASLLLTYFLPPGTNFDIIMRVIIMVTLFAAAYIAEVIRGGLAALPRGQYEAADALGLDFWKAQRLIIMPQALKISIPGIVSTFIGLFKDTTLVIFVGLLDPLKGITDAVRASLDWNGVYWEPFIFSGVIFFIICFGMSRYSMYLERKLQREHR